MIIFYNKKTGQVVGTIDGRVHSAHQLKMWIGDREENGRIVCDWKPTGKEIEVKREREVFDGISLDEHGEETPIFKKVTEVIKDVEFEPDHLQKDVFMSMDRKETRPLDYEVDPKTKELKLKKARKKGKKK